jgi:hypothetical protein
MMSHEECIEYIGDNELTFDPANYYGNLSLKYESGIYYWSVGDHDGHCWHEIPDYLGDVLVNYYREDND